MKLKVEGKTEFKRFTNAVRTLLKVPHIKLKAKLDTEQRAKNKRQAKTSSAFRASNDRD